MSGGAIICFVAVIKKSAGGIACATFSAGFMYSVNYVGGFVAIEEILLYQTTGFTAESAVASSPSIHEKFTAS